MMKSITSLLGFGALVLTVGCHSPAPATKSDAGSTSYAAQGVVEQIAPDHHQVTIHHQAIPGYMMEMTMDFPVNDASELDGISRGDNVTFTLVVNKDTAYVKDIHRTGHSDTPTTNAMSMPMPGDTVPKLKPGDKLPDSELLAEDGKAIHLSDFHGKAVALTFFFTRCPLPNYCPLMNRNFSEARTILLSTPGAPKNWQFLSISFDSEFDRPQTLTSYATFYRNNNPDRWLFASASSATLADLAPRIGLMIMGQDANITHNLRTVVVDSEGRLSSQFNDNLWTPQQLVDAITKAATSTPTK
jgi:protein SCO1/2